LADLGVTFEEINIEEVEGTAEIVEKVNGGNRTVPTLVFQLDVHPKAKLEESATSMAVNDVVVKISQRTRPDMEDSNHFLNLICKFSFMYEFPSSS
jgi:hypothetical protein